MRSRPGANRNPAPSSSSTFSSAPKGADDEFERIMASINAAAESTTANTDTQTTTRAARRRPGAEEETANAASNRPAGALKSRDAFESLRRNRTSTTNLTEGTSTGLSGDSTERARRMLLRPNARRENMEI
jgi:hypothetical protein